MSASQTHPAQFTLLALFVAMTAFCFLLGAIAVFGFAEVTVTLAGLALLGYATAVWGAFYAVAPEAAKYFAVVGTILFMLIAPLPMVLQQQRDQTRRLHATNNLRQLGMGLAEHQRRGQPIAIGRRQRLDVYALFSEPEESLHPSVIQFARARTPLEAQIVRARWERDDRDYPLASPVYFEP